MRRVLKRGKMIRKKNQLQMKAPVGINFLKIAKDLLKKMGSIKKVIKYIKNLNIFYINICVGGYSIILFFRDREKVMFKKLKILVKNFFSLIFFGTFFLCIFSFNLPFFSKKKTKMHYININTCVIIYSFFYIFMFFIQNRIFF